MHESLDVMTGDEWTILQGDPKKMSHSVFELKSVLDVGLDFSACVLESEF